MSDHTWADFQRQENGDDSPQPIAYTADEVAEYQHENPDDPDCAVLNMVMERNMADRAAYWEEKVAVKEAEIADLIERLAEYES